MTYGKPIRLGCCYADCEKDADWVVYSQPLQALYACKEHVGEVVDPSTVNVLYPLHPAEPWPMLEAILGKA